MGDVDEYIAGFPDDVRLVLEEFRAAVHRAAPGVTETISYRMPTFLLDGRPLVHLAGWKKHVALYPLPAGDTEVDAYRTETDTGRSRSGSRCRSPWWRGQCGCWWLSGTETRSVDRAPPRG